MQKIKAMFLMAMAVALALTGCSKDDDIESNISRFITVVNKSNNDISVIVVDGTVYNFPSRAQFTNGDVEGQVVNAQMSNDIYYTKGTRDMVEKGWPMTVFVADTRTLATFTDDYSQISHSRVVLTAKPANWTLTYPDDFQ